MAVRSSQEDFLLRELRKVAEMIARALGFRSKQDLPAARAEVDNAYATLLGPQAPILRVLDVESVVRLVNDSRKLAALSRLIAADASIAGDAGNDGARQQLMVRAVAIADCAVKLDPSDEGAIAAGAELRAR
ncbi:MAG: hypothetical protein ABI875_06750 [Gemmatimonadales bacterium]